MTKEEQISMTDNLLIQAKEKDRKSILRKRAEKLRKAPEYENSDPNSIQGLKFRLSDELFVIDTRYINEVIKSNGIIPLPCTPDHLKGIFNLRGKILAAIDIRVFLNLDIDEILKSDQIIIVQHEDIELGIIAEEVLGSVTFSPDSIQKTSSKSSENRTDYVSGVIEDELIVLKPEELLNDDRITIDY